MYGIPVPGYGIQLYHFVSMIVCIQFVPPDTGTGVLVPRSTENRALYNCTYVIITIVVIKRNGTRFPCCTIVNGAQLNRYNCTLVQLYSMLLLLSLILIIIIINEVGEANNTKIVLLQLHGQ